MAGTRETGTALLAGTAPGLAAIAGLIVGFVGPAEAAWLGAGGALALVILVAGSTEAQDSLYPAHVQLARFRRTEKPADILVVKLPPVSRIAGGAARRQGASAASSVLRVTDGVAIMPSLRGHGLCAVLEPDATARAAIENRLKNVCGSEVRLGWASFPEDGVTLESLIAVAADRAPDPRPLRRGEPRPELRPGLPGFRSLGRGRAPMGRAR